ncbi:hypothetical protein MTO96_009829 [Rhipicephalus appendiculatus]
MSCDSRPPCVNRLAAATAVFGRPESRARHVWLPTEGKRRGETPGATRVLQRVADTTNGATTSGRRRPPLTGLGLGTARRGNHIRARPERRSGRAPQGACSLLSGPIERRSRRLRSAGERARGVPPTRARTASPRKRHGSEPLSRALARFGTLRHGSFSSHENE